MKKCPYCAEEVQDAAVVCKYCKSPLPAASPQVASSSAAPKPAYSKDINWKWVGKWLGILVLAIIALKFWYIGIPAIVAWYLFKKKKQKFSKKTNIITTAVVTVLFISIGIASAHASRQPTLVITEPSNDASVQAQNINIKGKVNPSKSAITVNNVPVQADKDGIFTYETPLKDEKNAINVVATNGGKSVTQTVTVKRIFTPEEIAERERLKAEAEAKRQAELEAQKKAQAEAAAKAAAEQAAYDRTPAGKLCKAHPTWTKEDCERVANGKIWIGMGYDMLVASYGSKPNSANPSNYGSGTSWQWCWYDYKPSCFYDQNDDGLIDSYN